MVNEEYITTQLSRYGSADFAHFESRFNEFKEDFKDKFSELKEELKVHSFSSACEIIEGLMDECAEMGAQDLYVQFQTLVDHIQIDGCSSIKELKEDLRNVVDAFNDTVYMIEDIIQGAKRSMEVA
ncbi:MAG: hypothetical protein R2827_01720 [Bdellovibrionales bacterium]